MTILPAGIVAVHCFIPLYSSLSISVSMQAISCRHAFVRAAGASRSASRRARHVVAASAQKQPPTLCE
jgi:hypothetical protein